MNKNIIDIVAIIAIAIVLTVAITFIYDRVVRLEEMTREVFRSMGVMKLRLEVLEWEVI